MPRFRVANPASPRWNVFKTFVQIVIFWTGSLAVVPAAIASAESLLKIPHFHFPEQIPVASALFVLCSLLGLASAAVMAVRGRGTPLPYDSAREFVVTGPYAWIRNPMAVAGLGQGFAVGLGMGSLFVLGYVLAGGAIWQWLIRPAEEADLARRFGQSYQAYRTAVPCWRPRASPYRPAEATRELR